MDYDLTRLGPRGFEHLIQALSLQVLGPDIAIFGDGPDGGREASFQGLSTYPTKDNPWSGYGIMQAKFRQRPKNTPEDTKWLIGQIREELHAWADPKTNRARQGRTPNYILFATNVVLSPSPDSGGIDKVSNEIKRLTQNLNLPLRDFRVWHFDQICRLLDAHDEIRRTYAEALLPGDVLSRLLESLGDNDPGAASMVGTPGLPRDPRPLVGRDRELHEGSRRMESAGSDDRPVVVVTGAPGIGKSALALQLARRCAANFPEGQYHVDLTPAFPGAERADLVPELLRALLPLDEPLPQERQQQAKLLRLTLAQRKVLILIDDVTSEAALLELLGIEGPFALVCTSRAKLSGLTGLAHFIELVPLPEHYGQELVETIIRHGKLTGEQISALVRACAGHPFALNVAAAHLARRPHMNVDGYLREISSPDHAMRALTAGQTALEPVIERSFADLEPSQTHLLERLGMMPHMSVTPDIAAAVMVEEGDVHEALIQETTRLLDSLFESGLIEQIDEDRYVFHEILHRFARSKTARSETGHQETVIRRACQVLALRVRTAIHAIGFIDNEARIPADSNQRAIRMLEADRPGSVAMLELAHEHRLWGPLVLLISEITPWLAHANHWQEIVCVSEWLFDAGSDSDVPEWRTAALLNLGTAYSRSGETDRAIDFYRRSELSAQESRDPYLGHMAQLTFAELLIDLGQAHQAIRILRRGLRFWRQVEDHTTLARVLGNIGSANLLLGQVNQAEKYLNNSENLTKSRSQADPRIRNARGVLLRSTGRTKEAAERAFQDIERARAVGNRDWEAQSLVELSLTAPRDRPLSAPEDPLTLALDIYRETNDIRNQVRTLHLLGTTTARDKEIPKAAEYLAECANLATRIGDSQREADSLAYLAAFSGAMGRREEAEAYFSQAETAASHTGNPLTITQVLLRRARHYRSMGRANEALPFFIQAIEQVERTDNARILAELRADLGETLAIVGRWQEGAEVLEKILSVTSDHASENARAQAYRALGILHCHRGHNSEAATLLHRALEHHREVGDRSGVMHCHMALGNLHAQQEGWSTALEHYQVAAEIAHERRELPVLLSARSMQVTCYLHSGDGPKGLEESGQLMLMADRLGMLQIKGGLHANVGDYLAISGDHESALVEFSKALTVANSLNDHTLQARCLLNAAHAHLALRNTKLSRDAARESLAIRQRLGNWTDAANSLYFLLRLRLETEPETQQLRLPELVSMEPQVEEHTVAALRARLREHLEGDSVSSLSFPTGRRRIVLSDEVRRELVEIDVEALGIPLGEGRAWCFSCGLMIDDDGEAELLLLRSGEQDPLRASLAHPHCMVSSVIDVRPAPPDRLSIGMECECILFGGDTAGVVVDCHGGELVCREGNHKDVILSDLRRVGFVDLRSWIHDKQDNLFDLRNIARVEGTWARLDSNQLSISGPDGPLLTNAPLSFLPQWYEKARQGTLVIIFGRNLQGMMADDPSFTLRATELGRIVGATVRLSVKPPRRNASCICHPSTGLKFKKCCGRNGDR